MPIKPGSPQLMPRQIAELCHKAGWRDLDLVKMVATCLSESNGYVWAYHDNEDSRDVGLFQINIPVAKVGSQVEEDLYKPAVNVKYAKELWMRRKYQPWYGYTLGWATFPEWWVWTSSKPQHWAPTGRYLHRAVRGVANFYAERLGIPGSQFVDYVSVPSKPVFPPEDGVGVRPVKNDGRT